MDIFSFLFWKMWRQEFFFVIFWPLVSFLERLLKWTFGVGDWLRLLDLERLCDLDLDLGQLCLDLDLGDLDLDLDPNLDWNLCLMRLIRLPSRSTPFNSSRADFISLSDANSTNPSFFFCLWASAKVTLKVGYVISEVIKKIWTKYMFMLVWYFGTFFWDDITYHILWWKLGKQTSYWS